MKKAIMSMAHQVRVAAANTYGGKVSDYVFGIALEMTWEAHKAAKESKMTEIKMLVTCDCQIKTRKELVHLESPIPFEGSVTIGGAYERIDTAEVIGAITKAAKTEKGAKIVVLSSAKRVHFTRLPERNNSDLEAIEAALGISW